jgi:hypothetical protein
MLRGVEDRGTGGAAQPVIRSDIPAAVEEQNRFAGRPGEWINGDFEYRRTAGGTSTDPTRTIVERFSPPSRPRASR